MIGLNLPLDDIRDASIPQQFGIGIAGPQIYHYNLA